MFDPFLGTGTSVIAAVRHGRRGAGAETVPKYVDLARERIEAELAGTLRTRPMHKPVYDPVEAGNSLTIAPWTTKKEAAQWPSWRRRESGKGTAPDEDSGNLFAP